MLEAASLALAALGLYSVITTVTLLTVTSRVWAELLSTFFRRGGWRRRAKLPPRFSLRGCMSPLLEVALVAGTYCWATCWATSCGLMRGLRVDVPLRTSHIRHLNASAVFLNVHTLQSQKLSSNTLACLFVLRIGLFLCVSIFYTTLSTASPTHKHLRLVHAPDAMTGRRQPRASALASRVRNFPQCQQMASELLHGACVRSWRSHSRSEYACSVRRHMHALRIAYLVAVHLFRQRRPAVSRPKAVVQPKNHSGAAVVTSPAAAAFYAASRPRQHTACLFRIPFFLTLKPVAKQPFCDTRTTFYNLQPRTGCPALYFQFTNKNFTTAKKIKPLLLTKFLDILKRFSFFILIFHIVKIYTSFSFPYNSFKW